VLEVLAQLALVREAGAGGSGKKHLAFRPAHGEHGLFAGDLLLLDVIAKMMFVVLVRHLSYLAEAGTAVCFGVSVAVLADLLLAEFGLSYGVTGFMGQMAAKRGWKGEHKSGWTAGTSGKCGSNPSRRRPYIDETSLGVFAPLVGALVFKTSGGFEQSSLWVRFPYTPD
jgi:hypothetical protein